MNLILRDGWRYEERGDNNSDTAKTDYIRLDFKEFKKQFDLSSFQFVQTDDSVNRNNERVYSMRQLNIAIDSLKKKIKKYENNWMKRLQMLLSGLPNILTVLPEKNQYRYRIVFSKRQKVSMS